jgi:rod shape-determining protein MreD
LLRSDVWPIWVGLPLGLIDDLYSGHPIGTAPFAWTMTLIALALLDRRVVYRSWWFEWLVGTLALGFVVLVSALLARAGDIAEIVELVAPQWALSALLLPLFVKMTATTDRWRLS